MISKLVTLILFCGLLWITLATGLAIYTGIGYLRQRKKFKQSRDHTKMMIGQERERIKKNNEKERKKLDQKKLDPQKRI